MKSVFLKKKIPVRGQPPLDPNTYLICLGLKRAHFVQVFLKDGCRIPPSCTKWKLDKKEKAGI